MPITLYASEGVLNEAAEQEVFAELTDIFLKHHNLNGNTFLTPNVIGEVSIIPNGKSFSGGKPAEIAIIELKVPSFALGTPEQKRGFVADATEAVHRATEGRVPRDRVWVNMVYAVDGLWGIQGQAYSNDQLLQSVSQAAAWSHGAPGRRPCRPGAPTQEHRHDADPIASSERYDSICRLVNRPRDVHPVQPPKRTSASA